MNRLKQHPALAVLFALALLVGGYGTVRAQQTEAPQDDARPDSTACPMMGEGGMMDMEGMDMQAMMERCPMMQAMMEDGADGEAGMGRMMEMMKDCPMMAQMMERCPMMGGMMEGMMRSDSTMHGMMHHEGMMQGMNGMGGTPTPAVVENGVQTVNVTVGPGGFAPDTVRLEAGVPARLVFTRTVDSECSSQVRIPAFAVPATDLPLGEPVVVEFTPAEGGTFEFVCGMDMQRGSIMVRS
jgi:hypothetical protein